MLTTCIRNSHAKCIQSQYCISHSGRPLGGFPGHFPFLNQICIRQIPWSVNVLLNATWGLMTNNLVQYYLLYMTIVKQRSIFFNSSSLVFICIRHMAHRHTDTHTKKTRKQAHTNTHTLTRTQNTTAHSKTVFSNTYTQSVTVVNNT